MLLHVSMIVRLSDVLAPGLGLVKDKLGKVLEVVLRESDQKRLDVVMVRLKLLTCCAGNSHCCTACYAQLMLPKA